MQTDIVIVWTTVTHRGRCATIWKLETDATGNTVFRLDYVYFLSLSESIVL